MDSSWRELMILLRSDLTFSHVCINTIADIAPTCELPDIFHEICFNYLSDSSQLTRTHASLLLHCLADRHRATMHPLLSKNSSDGELLALSNLNVSSIADKDHLCLYSSKSRYVRDSKGDRVYKKQWLEKQRIELHKRLGLEITSTDARIATAYEDGSSLLAGSDVVIVDTSPVAPCSSEGGVRELLALQSAATATTSTEDSKQQLTDETWLARLTRFLVVGLLDPRWETRHGCCLGLTALLDGLYPASVYEAGPDAPSPAHFLLTDIACCCLCLLGLDRLVDFDCAGGDSGVGLQAPVKDMAARLLAVVTARMESQSVARVVDILSGMCALRLGHWSVRMGGVVGLISISSSGASLLAAARQSLRIVDAVSITKSIIQEGRCAVDDLIVAAARLVAVTADRSSAPTMAITQDASRIAAELGDLVDAIALLAEKLPADDCAEVYLSMWEAVVAALFLLQGLAATSNCTSQSLDTATSAVHSLSILVPSLCARPSAVRRRCIQAVNKGLQALLPLIRSIDQADEVVRARLRESCCALCGALLASTLCTSATAAPPMDSPTDSNHDDGSLETLGTTISILWRCCFTHLTPHFSVADNAMQELILCVTCGTTAQPTSHENSAPSKTAGSRKRKAMADGTENNTGDLDCLVAWALRGVQTVTDASLWTHSRAHSRLDFAVLIGAIARTWEHDGARQMLLTQICNEVAASAERFNATRETAKTLFPAAPETTGLSAVVKRPALRFSIVPDVAVVQKTNDSSAPQQSSSVRPVATVWLSDCGTSPDHSVCRRIEGLLLVSLHAISSFEGNATGRQSNATKAAAESIRRLGSLLSRKIMAGTNALLAWLLATLSPKPCDAMLQLLVDGTADKFPPQYSQRFAELLAAKIEAIICSDTAGVSLTALLRSDAESKSSACSGVLQALARHLQEHFFAVPDIARIVQTNPSFPSDEFSLVHLLGITAACLNSAACRSLLSYDVLGRIIAQSCEQVDCDASSDSSVVEVVGAFLSMAAKSEDSSLASQTLLQVIAAVDNVIQTGLASSNQSVLSQQSARAASLFHALTARLHDQVLPQFDAWFRVALSGVGCFDPSVRRPCTAVFRILVPLAPMARELARDRDGSSSELLRQLFCKHEEHGASAVVSALEDDIIRELGRCTHLVAVPQPLVPNLAPVSLRSYQWEGVKWLTQLRRCGVGGGILADEMGLGKSLQALATVAVNRVEAGRRTGPSLVVCPASLTLHWEQEVAKYFPPDLLMAVRYAKPSSSKSTPQAFSTLDDNVVLIVSYDALRSNPEAFAGRVWEYAVLDEAHLVRNPHTATAQVVFSLRARCRVALTGTPVQNRVEELWSLMNFLVPDYLGGYSEFRKHTVNPVLRAMRERVQLRQQQQNLFPDSDGEDCDEKPSAVSPSNDKQAAAIQKKTTAAANKALAKFNHSVSVSAAGLALLRKLHKQVLPFVLRRTKARVAAELPPKTIVDILCPLSAEQRHLYATFQTGLSLSDDSLARELQDLLDNKPAPAIAARKVDSALALDASGFDDEDEEMGPSLHGSKRLHPLQALTYLKLLSVHPSLVVSGRHSSYRRGLVDAHDSSGKLLMFTRLLLDSGVVTREEFRCADSSATLEMLLGAEVNGKDGALTVVAEAVNDSDTDFNSDSSDNAEEDSECQGKKSRSRGTTRKKAMSSKRKPSAISTDLPAGEPVVVTHRCLVFAQHTATLDLIEALVLRRYFPAVGYERLDGRVPAVRRATIAKRFNDQQLSTEDSRLRDEDSVDLMTALPAVARSTRRLNVGDVSPSSDIRILLMTTGACGLGLNLTAADTVVFVEHSWNPSVDLQAMDRAHRLGQTRPVTVYRLLAESTIEARIMGLQGLKQLVANEIINDENTGGFQSGGGEQDTQRSGKGFGGMLWDSLTIFEGSASGSTHEDECEVGYDTEENLDVESFLKSLGQ